MQVGTSPAPFVLVMLAVVTTRAVVLHGLLSARVIAARYYSVARTIQSAVFRVIGV